MSPSAPRAFDVDLECYAVLGFLANEEFARVKHVAVEHLEHFISQLILIDKRIVHTTELLLRMVTGSLIGGGFGFVFTDDFRRYTAAVSRDFCLILRKHVQVDPSAARVAEISPRHHIQSLFCHCSCRDSMLGLGRTAYVKKEMTLWVKPSKLLV